MHDQQAGAKHHEGDKHDRCEKHYGKKLAYLCPVSLGVALGVVNGLGIFLLRAFGANTAMQAEVVRMFGGNDVSNIFYGFGYGFFNAFVLALVYDWCICWFRKCHSVCGRCGSHRCKC